MCQLGAVIFLLLASWQDFKKQEILDVYTGGFCVCCAIIRYAKGDEGLAFVLVCICLLVLSVEDVSWLGGADVAIILGLIGFFGLVATPIIAFWFSSLALIIYFLERKIVHSTVLIQEDGHIILVPIIAMSIIPIVITLDCLGLPYGW